MGLKFKRCILFNKLKHEVHINPLTPEFFFFCSMFSLFFCCSLTGSFVMRCRIYQTLSVKGLNWAALIRKSLEVDISVKYNEMSNFLFIYVLN